MQIPPSRMHARWQDLRGRSLGDPIAQRGEMLPDCVRDQLRRDQLGDEHDALVPGGGVGQRVNVAACNVAYVHLRDEDVSYVMDTTIVLP